METKAQLRKRMKAIRDGISPILRQRKNEQIMNALLREDWYADAKIICVYAAIASEVDLCNFFVREHGTIAKSYTFRKSLEKRWSSMKSMILPV